MRHSSRCGRVLPAALAVVGVLTVLPRASAIEWVHQARLLPSVPVEGDYFGHSVSISGDTAVVGAYVDDDSAATVGAAYVYRRSGSDWTEVARLTPGSPTLEDYFGENVAVSGNTAIVGARMDDVAGHESGSAYVFQDDGAGWTQVAKLVPDDADENDSFGSSVSLSGNTAIIGAGEDDDNNVSGSAYIFRNDGAGWTQAAKLLPGDGAGNDYFGGSVSIDGNTAVVGAVGHANASGAAYVFQDDGAGWSQVAKLTADDGAAEDLFGNVSVSGDTVVVGSRWDDDNGSSSGSAYVFQRIGPSWTQVAKLLPDDGAARDYFGQSVGIDGLRVIVGAQGHDGNAPDSGSAYVFQYDGSGWTQTAKLLPEQPADYAGLGRSISISGDVAVAGVSYQGFDAVEVYAVPEPGTIWLLSAAACCLMLWRRWQLSRTRATRPAD